MVAAAIAAPDTYYFWKVCVGVAIVDIAPVPSGLLFYLSRTESIITYFFDVVEGVVDDGGEVVDANPLFEGEQEGNVSGSQTIFIIVIL